MEEIREHILLVNARTAGKEENIFVTFFWK